MRKQYPLLGMILLVPILKVTQVEFVIAVECAALQAEEPGYRMGCYGEVIERRL